MITIPPYPRKSGSLSVCPRVLGLCGITLIALAGTAQAQTVPDAGQLLREQPKPPVVAPAKPLQIAPPAPTTAEPDRGPKVLVKGFRIQGALLIPEAELTAQLQAAIGKELSFSQLKGLADALTGYYAQRGYLARVIVPPQDVKDGIVILQVIEGKRGSLRIDNQGQRIDVARIQRMIDARLAAGSAMDLGALGEAMNILNEQPGVATTTSLAPGKGEAEIDLAVSAKEKPLLGYALGANNHGPKGTGSAQVSGSVTLANPSGNFDAASLLVNANQGSTFGRADYSLAAGDSGLRLGLNVSYLDYHVIQSDLSALNAHGTASTAGLTASYPLARRNDVNLSVTGGIDFKKLIDHTIAGEIGNRRVNVANLGLSGYTNGSFIGSGVTSFGATLSFGESDQRNAGALATDRTTRQTQGGFSKIGYNFGYLQGLGGDWSLNTTLRGQFAGNNLDSSERFSLGGPSGIRAYPVGEASGDDGWLASLIFTRKMSNNLATSLFLDAGGIRQNHTLWANWNAGNPRLDNTYQLAGLGLGLDWRVDPQIILSASIAGPLGNNPGRDAQGHDVDGKHGTRGWLSLNAQF